MYLVPAHCYQHIVFIHVRLLSYYVDTLPFFLCFCDFCAVGTPPEFIAETVEQWASKEAEIKSGLYVVKTVNSETTITAAE